MPYNTLAKQRTYRKKHYRKNREKILASAWGKRHPIKRRKYLRAWYAKNKTRLSAYQRAYYKANKEKKHKQARERYRKNRTKLLKRYRAAYKTAVAAGKRFGKDRVKATRKPPKQCECCGRKQKRALSLDHCHVRKIFRGWLCLQCNIGLGMFGDKVAVLKSAIAYLERAA